MLRIIIGRKQQLMWIVSQCLLFFAVTASYVCSFQSDLLCYREAISATNYPKAKKNLHLHSKAKDDNEEEEDSINPFVKASWYAVEAFGKVFAGPNDKNKLQSKASEAIDLGKKPSSLQEALLRIEMDNARSYFLSGDVDVMAYDKDCIFADPFVSFSGRDRFVENLSNLGSFITTYDAKMLKYEVEKDEKGLPVEVKTKLMVKLELNLPWKPILAWPWGVTYTLDSDTFLITKHVESWDISPWKGVQQIFRKPTVTIQTNGKSSSNA